MGEEENQKYEINSSDKENITLFNCSDISSLKINSSKNIIDDDELIKIFDISQFSMPTAKENKKIFFQIIPNNFSIKSNNLIISSKPSKIFNITKEDSLSFLIQNKEAHLLNGKKFQKKCKEKIIRIIFIEK